MPDADEPRAQPQPPKLLDRLRSALRVRHYSIRTEESYVAWARRYILFHGKRHPKELGAPEVGAFLSHLAVQRDVGAVTQNQARNALLFLYRVVLGQPLEPLDDLVRARTTRPLPRCSPGRRWRASSTRSRAPTASSQPSSTAAACACSSA